MNTRSLPRFAAAVLALSLGSTADAEAPSVPFLRIVEPVLHSAKGK